MLFALFVKCFFYVLFGGVFLGAGMKGYGVFWHIAGADSHTACELPPFPFQG